LQTTGELYPSKSGNYFLTSLPEQPDSTCASDGVDDVWIFSSALNLTSFLRVINDAAQLLLEGTAADVNFKSYSLEYATVAEPDVWTLIQPPSNVPVVNDSLGTWVPSFTETFLVRLTVSDLGGNSNSDIKLVVWEQDVALVNVSQSENLMSPLNMDGYKDSVSLTYDVLRPLHVAFKVLDMFGVLVWSEQLDHLTAGTYSLDWDGRLQDGSFAVDGIYTLMLNDFETTVSVDNTEPDVGIILTDESLSAHAIDSTLVSWQIESGDAPNPQTWVSYQAGTSNVDASAGASGLSKDVIFKTLSFEDLADIGGKVFRIRAQDRAGNVSTATSGTFPEKLLAVKWDGVEGVFSSLSPAELDYREHEIVFYESYIRQIINPVLQYRIDAEWFDTDASIVQQKGIIKGRWDNSGTGNIEAIRLRAEDEFGREILSEEINVGISFSVTQKCDDEESKAIKIEQNLISPLQKLTIELKDEDSAWRVYRRFGDSSSFMIPVEAFTVLIPQSATGVRVTGLDGEGREQLVEIAISEAMGGCLPLVNLKRTDFCGSQQDRVMFVADVKRSISLKSLAVYDYFGNVEKFLGEMHPIYSSIYGGHVSTLDIHDLEEGTHDLIVSLTYVDLDTMEERVIYYSRKLVVDLTVPTANIDQPVPGTILLSYGLNPDYPGQLFPITASIQDNNPELYYRLSQGQDLINSATIAPGDAQELEQWNFAGLDSGFYSFDLEVRDKAGNLACESMSVQVIAELPDPVVTVSSEIFSPNDDGLFDRATIQVKTEPALVDISIVKGTDPDGESVAQLATGLQCNGSCSIEWDGLLSSGITAVDGRYTVVAKTSDSYGRHAQQSAEVEVDTTVPALFISYPAASSPLGVVAQIIGTAIDKNMSRYKVEISYGVNDPSWRLIGEGSISVENRTLSEWNTYGEQRGDWSLRLLATDMVGNTSTLTRIVNLPEQPLLISDLSVIPEYISPNSDNIQDQTSIGFFLEERCDVTLYVANDVGQSVRTFTQLDVAAGIGLQLWDGLDESGTAVADGVYVVTLAARNPSTGIAAGEESIFVKVDTTPPTIELTAPLNQSFLNADVIDLVGTIDDPNLQGYRADFAGTSPFAPFSEGTIPLVDSLIGTVDNVEEGEYLLHVTATDLAGNSTELQSTVTIDRTPPLVSIDAPESGMIFGGFDVVIVPITGAIDELNQQGYVLRYGAGSNPADWTTLEVGNQSVDDQFSYEWSEGQDSLVDGVYVLSLLAMDQVGLTGEVRVEIEIDTTAPIVSLASLGNGDFVSGPFAVVGSLFDDHLQSSALEFASGTCAEADSWTTIRSDIPLVENGSLFDWQQLPADGNYCLRLTATDSLGLTNSVQTDLAIDSLPPESPVLSGEVILNSDVQLEWQVGGSDPVVGFNLYRNGVQINSELITEYAMLDATLSEADYSYSVTAVDPAGNESYSSNVEVFKIDRTAPNVKITSPQNDAFVTTQLDLIGTAFSADDFKAYRVYFGPDITGVSPPLIFQSTVPVSYGSLSNWDVYSLADGKYLIKVEVEDQRGNLDSAEISVFIDNTPPSAPTNLVATISGATVSLVWESGGSADEAGFLIYRNGRFVNVPGHITGSLLPFLVSATSYADSNVVDGVHDYMVVAMDSSGNLSAPSVVERVSLDNKSPQALVVVPGDGILFTEPIVVKAETEDLDIEQVVFKYRLAGTSNWNVLSTTTEQPYVAVLDPLQLLWTYGDYELSAVASDIAGNVDLSPATTPVSFPDVYPPNAPTGLSHIIQGNQVIMDWDDNAEPDLAEYYVYKTKGSVTTRVKNDPQDNKITESFMQDVAVLDGAYTYEVSAVDLEGNESARSAFSPLVIFAPILVQPELYVDQAFANIEGNNALSGDRVELYRVVTNEATLVSTAQILDDATFSFAAVPLVQGVNVFQAQVTDTDGSSSRISTTISLFNAELLPPAGLTAMSAGDGYDVQLSWLNPEQDYIVGYNLYRDGELLTSDSFATLVSAESTSASYSASSAIDGNSSTYWWSAYHYTGDPPIAFTTFLSEQTTVKAIEIDWYYSYYPTDYTVLFFVNGEWQTVFDVSDNNGSSNRIVFASPIQTSSVRLLIRSGARSNYAIRELRILESGVLEQESFLDTAVEDGRHLYQVSSLDRFYNESILSAPVQVDIGDVAAPDQPAAPTVTVVDSDVSLDWSVAPNTEADLAGYFVYRYIDGVWTKLNETLLVVPTFYDSSLVNGSHRYYITAVDLVGNESLPSDEVLADVLVETLESQIVSVSAVPEGTALQIDWLSVDNTVSYNLYRRHSSESLPVLVNQELLVEASMQDVGLNNGETYYYSVAVVDSIGNAGVVSEEVSGVPLDSVSPSTPLIVTPVSAGGSITVSTNLTDISGIAEPGSTVDIFSAGDLVAHVETRAPASEYITTLSDYSYAATVSDDGTKIGMECYSINGGCVVDLLTGETESHAFDYSVMAWSPDLSKVAYTDYSGIKILTLATNEQISINSVTWIQRWYLSWSADGRKIVFIGDQDGNYYDIWVYDCESGVATPLTSGEDSWDIAVSPNGSQVAYYSSAGLNIIDTETLQVFFVSSEATDIPKWSPDGSKLAYEVRRADWTRELEVYNIETSSSYIISSDENGYWPIRWSQDSSFVAFQSKWDNVVIVSAESGDLIFEKISDVWDFGWHPAGYLLIVDNQEQVVSQTLPGAFIAQDISLEPGENQFYAIAADASGNQSISSDVITIIRDDNLYPRADLSLTENDIFLYPAAVQTGEQVTANIVVQNLSAVDTTDVEVDLYLLSPSGHLDFLGTRTGDILGGQSLTFPLTVTAGTDSGSYSILVLVDPRDLIKESMESNNFASREFIVLSGDESVQIGISADRNSYEAGQGVSLAVSLLNAGQETTGSLKVEILDANGIKAADLLIADIALPFGTSRQTAIWNTDQYFAGDYQAVATLDTADGVIASATVPFAIISNLHAGLTVSADKTHVAPNGVISITTEIDSSGSNKILENAQLKLEVLDPSDNVVLAIEKPLNAMLPGSRFNLVEQWNVGMSLPGSYRVKCVVFHNNQELSAAELTFNVDAVTRLTGNVVLLPNTVSLGNAVTARYQLSNAGNSAFNSAVQLRIIDTSTFEVISSTPIDVALLAGGSVSGETSFSTDSLRLTSYSAQLVFTTTLAEELLDSALLTVRDGTSPILTILSPQQGMQVDSSVLFEVLATDTLSIITSVEYRVDNGVWYKMPYADLLTGRYALNWTIKGTTPTHTVEYRATDSAGNITASEPVNFEASADQIAPVTTIQVGLPSATVISKTVVTSETEFTLTAVDDLSQVVKTEYQVDNGAWIMYSGPFRLSSLSDGEYVIGYRSLDSYDNLETAHSLNVVMDSAAPVVIIDLPVSDTFHALPVQPVYSIEDAYLDSSKTLVVLNEVPYQSGEPISIEGEYLLHISAEDILGHQTESSVNFVIDQTLPKIVVTGVGTGHFYNTEVTPQIAIEELYPKLSSITLNNEKFISGSALLIEGSYNLVVEAEDKAGNRSNETVTFVVDLTAPVISVEGVESDQNYKTQVTPIIAVSDDYLDITAVTLNGTPFVSGSVIQEEGQYDLLITAKDKAGNATKRQVSFTVDFTPPVITVSGVEDSSHVNTSVTLQVDITDVRLFESVMTLDGVDFVSGTILSAEGSYELIVHAVDLAGNEADTTFSNQLRLLQYVTLLMVPLIIQR